MSLQYSKHILVGCVVGVGILTSLYAWRGTVALFLWDTFRADEIALRLDSESALLARRIGNYYFNVFGSGKHDLEKARQAYTLALKRDTNIPFAHYQLGRISFIRGDFSGALAELDDELKIGSDFPNIYYMRGLIYGFRNFKGDLERAEENFSLFVEKVPTNWAGYNDLAWIKIKQGEYHEARMVVQLAFERMPVLKENNVWLWTALGIVYLNTDAYNESRDAFVTAEKIAETMTPEYFWSAYPGNDPRNAEEAFRQFRSTLYFNMGIVYEKLEKWDESKGYYEKYIAMLPKGPFPTKNEVELKIDQLYEKIQ